MQCPPLGILQACSTDWELPNVRQSSPGARIRFSVPSCSRAKSLKSWLRSGREDQAVGSSADQGSVTLLRPQPALSHRAHHAESPLRLQGSVGGAVEASSLLTNEPELPTPASESAVPSPLGGQGRPRRQVKRAGTSPSSAVLAVLPDPPSLSHLEKGPMMPARWGHPKVVPDEITTFHHCGPTKTAL